MSSLGLKEGFAIEHVWRKYAHAPSCEHRLEARSDVPLRLSLRHLRCIGLQFCMSYLQDIEQINISARVPTDPSQLGRGR